jgi:phage-related protein
MKSLDAAYLAKLAAQENQPRLLYEIGLDSGTLYLCDGQDDIVFPTGGQTYTAYGVQHERIQTSGSNVLDTVSVSICNVSKLLGKFVVHENFRGRSLIIRRVFADLLGSADYAEIIFAGDMKEPVVDQYKISVEAVSGKPLRRKEPVHSYTRQCRWELADSHCQAVISSYEVEESNAPDSGSTTTLIDSDLSAVDDIYAEGMLECDFTEDTYTWTEKRRISGYVSGTKTITVALPFSASTATAVRWKAIAGCDKTWDCCYTRFKNLMNFGGFVHVR